MCTGRALIPRSFTVVQIVAVAKSPSTLKILNTIGRKLIGTSTIKLFVGSVFYRCVVYFRFRIIFVVVVRNNIGMGLSMFKMAF